MIRIRRYVPADKELWNGFVADSKNATFLFFREYMDYHADRFRDHSLLFFDEKERLVALLPGNETTEPVAEKTGAEQRVYYSHQGLTYGGFLLSLHSRMAEVMQLFGALLDYLKGEGFAALYYKRIPTIYHRYPAQEDGYALWRCGAQMTTCLISSTVLLEENRIQAVAANNFYYCRKAKNSGYCLCCDALLSDFWPIMVENLRTRYGVAPVHTLDEMQLLQSCFPDNIRCFLAIHDDADGTMQAVAGAVVYEAAPVVHVQYGHATPEGKKNKVLDFLYLSLIEHYAQDSRFRYFDFGTSNEDGGRFLNEGLIANKEGFGGRGVVYETYKLTI